MTLDAATVRVTESDFYFDDPYPVYKAVREESPVFWHEKGRFWVLTRYADIEQVSKDAETFSSGSGILLTDVLKSNDFLSKMYPQGTENVSTLDPPRHGQVRRLMNFAFSRPRIMAMVPRIQTLVRNCLASFDDGKQVDVVPGLSIPVTANVIKAFIDCEDLPAENVVAWSDDVFKMATQMSEQEFMATVERIKPMFAYFLAKVEERRNNPKDDFIGQLLASELDGAALSELMIEAYCQTVMVAGNETTRNAYSAAIRLFAEFPDEYRRLRENPELVESAVEEILRYHNPTIGFLRMATRDTEIGGTPIAKGQHVYMVYGAANRDPEVFADPDKFDIGRFVNTTQTHLTFGKGPHICIGMALARLELRILLEELISRYSGMELAGPIVRPDTLLGNGYVSLPARFLTD